MCPLYAEHLGQNVFQELNELLYPDFVPDLALAVRGQNKGRRGGKEGNEIWQKYESKRALTRKLHARVYIV